MIPALHYLDEVAPSLPLNEITFFTFTGGLSSVLDNAPTYVTFFEMAGRVGSGGASHPSPRFLEPRTDPHRPKRGPGTG